MGDRDERTRDARAFDLFVDLLTGSEQPSSWQAEVIVPFSMAQGGDLELAEIPGLGPILPSTARDLLDRCHTVTRVAVDDHGKVIAVSDPIRTRLDLTGRLAAPPALRDLTGRGYVFPPRLRRYLAARDRTCVYPGCGKPAACCDKDHRDPWPGGATSAGNGQCLCRHHHRAKQAVFTVTLQPDGSYLWTTRGGWQFRRHPKGF